MFSYVDFGFMLDFIVFIMRSLVVSEVLEMLEVIINSPLFCLTASVYQHLGPRTPITLLAGL